ncbi:hypothetical protein JDV02_007936 [Purpureocillium takamizusanense]|uniref:Uncharacterized protein n=1 Tax=Purpureocillium takamizusanense TaxID=2060973 RepID=A0A9Q8QNI0_9HYPO|nr:uncharacterized protein JDV02_007936 [Purpureocillium takamizusanense]UNI22006.1 hypothetical protein JDV02_007936 [Purpureocillium takamizusanense]
MALLNPVYAFMVPFLFIVTAPLALFAGITTTLAFSVLILRVLIVYLDIALSLVPSYFKRHQHHPHPRHDGAAAPRGVSPAATSSSAHSVADYASPPTPTQQQVPLFRRRRRRPSSATSIVSAGSSTPSGNVDAGLGLVPSVGAERDFEGIGGWRSGKDGDDDDDNAWTTINSRFEFPYARSHHNRTPSGGAWPPTPGDSGVLMMKSRRSGSPDSRHSSKGPASPNSSRARTPSASRVATAITMGHGDSYFPLAMSPAASKKVPGQPA